MTRPIPRYDSSEPYPSSTRGPVAPILAAVPSAADIRQSLLKQFGKDHKVVKAAHMATDSELVMARETQAPKNRASMPLKVFIQGEMLSPYLYVQYQLDLPEGKQVPLVVYGGKPHSGSQHSPLEVLQPGADIHVVANSYE